MWLPLPVRFRNIPGFKLRLLAALSLSLGLHAALLAGDWRLSVSAPRIPAFQPIEVSLVNVPSPSTTRVRLPAPPNSTPSTVAQAPVDTDTRHDQNSEPLVQARSDIASLNNPRPVYPHAARLQGIEGRVLLLAHVLADGRCADVQLQQTSGHAQLDEAALNAVRRWRFIPAYRGQDAVDSRVIVPIRFRLDD